MHCGRGLKANLKTNSAELGRSQAKPVNFIAQALPVHRMVARCPPSQTNVLRASNLRSPALRYTCTSFSTSRIFNENTAMRIVTYSEARSSLKSVLDAVHDDADVTVISRRDGADAVVMSFDHYQSIMETMHLLSTPANAAHLAKSIAQHKAGKAVRRELVKV